MTAFLRCAVLGVTIGIGCFGAWSERATAAETLTLAGSTTFNSLLMVPYKADIETATGFKLNIVPSKSSEGLLALFAGKAQLAMISTSLEHEVQLLRESKPELPYNLLRSFLISRARVAFPVHPDNPVRSVNFTKLKQVLRGEIGNWRELGGPDRPIRVITVKEGGGVKRTVEAALFDGRRITPREHLSVEDAHEILRTIEQDRGALGLTQYAEVRKKKMPELRTNGVIEQSLYLVSLNEPNDAMRELIAAARRAVFDEAP